MLENFFEEIRIYSRSNKKFTNSERFPKNVIENFGSFSSKLPSWSIGVDLIKWNIVLTTIALFIVVAIFLLKSIDIQILKRQEYLGLAESNRLRRLTVLPERGVIYSLDGEIIARNQPAFSVQLNTQLCSKDLRDLSECKEAVNRLVSLTGFEIDKEKVFFEIDLKKPVIMVINGLNKDQILPFETQIKKILGLVVVVQPIREYVHSPEFAHVLGYIGLDEKENIPRYVGKTGIEEYYDEYLSGISGTQIAQIDSTGEFFRIVSEQDALPGKNVQTFLNSKLQVKAYELLKQKIEEGKPDPLTGFKAEAGVVVAQDPKTGGILAMVSYPSFDSNAIVKGLSNEEFEKLMADQRFPFFNRSIGAAYPPGSTFKMVPASAALTEKVITPQTTIFDPGFIQVGSYIFRNWNPSGHGDVNLVRALQVSNDTYFYTVGGGYGGQGGLGIEKLHDWAVRFGFGSKTGIDIDGEVEGYMPDGESRDWYLGDTYITSIGQGDVLATPLQVNNMVTYFANGGFLMVPRVVKSVDGVGEYESDILAQNLISKEYIEVIREGMKKAVQPGGTAYPLFDFPIRHGGIELGGKTGTSEYIDPEGNDRTHAWFSVFGPFDDATIALTVFLEGGGAGSDDASPIAKELLDLWLEDYK